MSVKPFILKPNTSYDFSDEDLLFVIQLAKVGSVHTLSSQVVLTSKTSIEFKENVGEHKCPGLRLPENWVIEYISAHEEQVHITFKVGKKGGSNEKS